MGNVYETLQARYHPTPVYYVQAFANNQVEWRKKLLIAIRTVSPCVVLLDDAHVWYDFSNFFGLFKGSGRLLVAAATLTPEHLTTNPIPLVYFQRRIKSNLAPREMVSLLGRLGVDPIHNDQMMDWFGDVYGRYQFLVPPLMRRWEEMTQRTAHDVTLADAFFDAATMEDDKSKRFLPSLDKTFKPLVYKIWAGTATHDECTTLVPYGILKAYKEWSCEYVRRKYFFDLFQPDAYVSQWWHGENIPDEFELAEIGFQGINWNRLKMSRQSSSSDFPVEDIWQAEFYSAIGECIPRPYVFCKEYATSSGLRSGSVDFVLRNGGTCGTRAIEFLIKSDRVGQHHERFENGAYTSLHLSGSYLVVDIKPWDNMPEIHDVSESRRLDVATECFNADALNKMSRRLNHAVFLVSNDLSSGILYRYDHLTQRAEVVQPSGRM